MSFGRTPEEELAERNRGNCRDSRDRGDRNRGGGGKNGGGGDHHHRRGGDSASRAGVAEGAAEGATLVQQPGQLAAALAEATEGGGMAPSQALDDAICKVIVGDTECPLQVCQLSGSSESTHFLFLRRDVALFDSTRAPDGF